MGTLCLAVAVLWCLALLIAGSGARRSVPDEERSDEQEPRRTDSASIMVLNWNGRDFLARLLPSLRKAVQHHGGEHQIILIDNGSDDDSVEFVRTEYPEVELVCHDTNHGFVEGYNLAWSAANRDIVILLNNDMVVDEGFLGPLLGGFEDPKTFAVSSQIFLANTDARRVETGLTGGSMEFGVIKVRHDEPEEHLSDPVPVLWAGGGSAAFDRRRLLELGGFDELFAPFYFEDTSLSYNAWKRGWNILLAPTSKVVHEHQGSTSRLMSPQTIARIQRRNQHLFVWSNVTDLGSTLASSLLLPINIARLALGSRGTTLWTRAWLETCAVLSALPRLLPTLRSRRRAARTATRTDAEVFALAHSLHRLERTRVQNPKTASLDLLMLAARVPRQGVDGSWGLFEQIRVLGRRHRITLFTLMDVPDDGRHLDALRPYVHRLEAHVIRREVGALDLHHRMPERLRQYYTAPQLRRRVSALLRCARFDLLQVDYLEMATLVNGLLGGVRSVHVVHEPMFRAVELRQLGGVIPRTLRFLRMAQAINFESRLYSQFAKLVCLSSKDAEFIHRWLPDVSLAVNPIGADVERISPCRPSTGHTLLSVANFGHPPNIDGTIWFVNRVFPRVRAEVPNVTVRLVGGGPTDDIVALAENPGVELVGYVEDLAPEMEACALTLAAVREGGGLRTKVLESFAYGRTAVVTPIGAAGIVAEDGVEFRIGVDERATADAIVELLRDDEKRHSMEEAARELVLLNYTNELMANRSEAVYRELMA